MQMAATSGTWTLDQLHALPDDGNKYELVRGDLFVTPAPSHEHEMILVRLTNLLQPYVAAQNLGFVFHPRAVVRYEGSEAEPDLMVRSAGPPGTDWDTAPAPLLVVEVVSPATRDRDYGMKRQLYPDADVAEYWIVDADTRAVTIVRRGVADAVEHYVIRWAPAAAAAILDVKLSDVFGA